MRRGRRWSVRSRRLIGFRSRRARRRAAQTLARRLRRKADRCSWFVNLPRVLPERPIRALVVLVLLAENHRVVGTRGFADRETGETADENVVGAHAFLRRLQSRHSRI